MMKFCEKIQKNKRKYHKNNWAARCRNESMKEKCEISRKTMKYVNKYE
jgi:hypothetical protein